MRLAALADLHVREDERHAWRDVFADISREADVLALCGDLTDLGKVSEAEILAEDLRSCSIPVVGVLGNHDYECDCAEEVSRIIRQAGVHLLESGPVEIDGVSFAGTKGFAGGFGRAMLGSFGEPAIKAFVSEGLHEAMRLENTLRTIRPGRVVVVLHYAPVVDTVVGEPLEIYPFLGSARLGETVDRFPVSAIVHGHAHHGAFEGRTARGIPVYNCARHIEKPGGRPWHIIEI